MPAGKRIKIPELTAATYDWFIKEKRFALLYCGAKWLADDAELREQIHHVAEVHADWMNVGAVDVDEVPNIARLVRLTNIPTVVYYEHGRIVEMVTGHDQAISDHVEALLARMDSAERAAAPATAQDQPVELNPAATRTSGRRPAIEAAAARSGARTAVRDSAVTRLQEAVDPIAETREANATRFYVWFWILLTAITALRVAVVLVGPLELSFDEAQYRHWARHMDWCYFSKGPGVAAMIRATTAIAGDGEFGVRLGAILCSVLTSVIAFYWSAGFFASARTALIASLTASAAPMLLLGGVVATIDAPFFLCWTAAVAAAWWAVRSNRLFAWVCTGLALAAGLQCKFTMGFFVPGLVLFALLSAPDRRLLLRAGFWVALLIAADSLLPILLWNSRHDWITFRHTLDKAGPGALFNLAEWPRSLGGQAAAISPLLFAATVVACVLCARDSFRAVPETAHFDGRRAKFLLAFFAPVFVFYLLLALHRHVEANWPVAGYLTGFAALAHYWGGTSWSRLRLSGFIVSLTVGLAMFAPLFLGDAFYTSGMPERLQSWNIPFEPRHDPINRCKGWKAMTAAALERADALGRQTGKDVFFLSDHYKYAAWIGYYGGVPDRVFVTPTPTPRSQYDVWRLAGRLPPTGGSAVIVYDVREPQPKIEPLFERVEADPDEFVFERAGYEVRRIRFLRGYGYKGDTATATAAATAP